MKPAPVTLQVSLAPSDYLHARELLPHQERVWRGQVAEILITVDFHRSKGRFSARWEEGAKHILPLARSIEGARVVEVDYRPEAKRRVADEFFRGAPVPEKDFRGGPFYSYFFGLSEASQDFVLHIDSDMFFGGGSGSWLQEAVAHYIAHSRVLIASPLPGPPAADGRIRTLQAVPDPEETGAFLFSDMSTRLFLLSRSRFRERIGGLETRRPPGFKNVLIALLEGNPPHDLPEHLFTTAMRLHGLIRRDFLGSAPGLWSLHPPYRGADFYEKLPTLVRRIEAGEVPDAQRGDHDINDSMVDWTEGRRALRSNRIWHRLARRLRSAVSTA